MRNAVERFPPQLFLRETPLTQPDAAIRRVRANGPRQHGGPTRRFGAAACDDGTALNREIAFDTDPTHARDDGGGGLRAAAGGLPGPYPRLCRRHARARHPGALYRRPLPPRGDGVVVARGRPAPGPRPTSRRWAGSALTRPTGSARTDAAMCGSRSGLDYRGAAPVRGTRYGGSGETLRAAVRGRPGAPAKPKLIHCRKRAQRRYESAPKVSGRREAHDVSLRKVSCARAS